MPIYRTKDNQGRTRFRYEFDRLVEGRRQRLTKLLPLAWNRSQAEEYARKQDGDLWAVATGSVKPRGFISDAVALYLKHRSPHLKNRISLERELANCLDAYAGRYIDELAGVALEYADTKGLSPGTIRNRLAYLRAACRYAWKHHGLGEHDPAERMSMPSVNNERHMYLTRTEVLHLTRKLRNPWARAVVLVAFYSGMRLGEIMRAEVTPQGWLLKDTKNGARRIVPIHPKVAYLARQWPPQCGSSTVQHALKRVSRAMGYKDLRFHDLRHSAASAMANAGVNQYTVGAVLGHKAGASTQRYSHLYAGTLEEAIRKIL
jgi:integrase